MARTGLYSSAWSSKIVRSISLKFLATRDAMESYSRAENVGKRVNLIF